MDKVKYRAWHKLKKRMYHVAMLYLDTDMLLLQDGDVLFSVSDEEAELMQFTDYKDRNKRDICDGDYLANAWGKYRVYWDRGGFVIQSEDGFRYNISEMDLQALEVIGNRDENPELSPFFSELQPKEG